MPTACVLRDRCRVQLTGERLEVWGPPPDDDEPGDKVVLLREIPLRDVERVVISESTHVTTPALAELLRRAIPLSLLDWKGEFLGGFQPPPTAQGAARLRQFERARDPELALTLAGRLVSAKLYNQRRVLQRIGTARAGASGDEDAPGSGPLDPEVQSALDWLDSILAGLGRSRGLEELRGYEGTSTARYFQTWARFLPEAFPFERRSTRPPLNPVNACISFGATLLYQEMVAACHAHGLDPAIGVYHATEDGRWSLALDLMEPFRPVLVEALALDLFSRRMVGKAHFESRNGGVYLNEAGRRKFLLQYERRMERQFFSECVNHRTTLRQQLDHQAVMLKTALDDPARFEPFLMN